jgi:hypothetical protein
LRGWYCASDSSVVHKGIDAPEFVRRPRHDMFAVGRIDDVGTYQDRAPSLCLNEFLRVSQSIHASGGQYDICAGLGQRLGEAHAQTTGRAGDNNNPPVQAEKIDYGHLSFFPTSRK